jgi:arabinogalactan oligomer / maltooligosaccharide transport system substrate-binding protein
LWQAHLQHQSDQQLAQDQQRATTLQTYLNNMQDLLLNHNLAKSTPGDEVGQVATVQTLTTLRSLDADRNRIVLQFLQEAHLIGVQDAVINLSNADLSNDDLSGADLSGVDLTGATLTDADLSSANLSSADLYGADLSSANLSDANLSDAYLFDAILTGAELDHAHLSNATLTGAFLDDTNANGATLTDALLNGADLSGARLDDAGLSDANLDRANLYSADLSGANLSYADLTGDLTQRQLDVVYSCTNATLSTGLRCHHNVRITLTYWYTESTTPEIPKLIHQFEQQNPYIEINAVQKPFLMAQSAFVTAAHAGNAPDIFLSDIGWVTQFASQRYLLNIDSYSSQDDLSDYLSIPLSYDYYNGSLYGLPQETDFLALLYNKAELERAGITSPPATMADFERDAEKVVQSKTATYGFETNGMGYYALPFLYAFGGGMFDQHNNILVNSNKSVDGLKFLLKLQNTDKVMPTNVNYSIGASSASSDFSSGKAAMTFGGSSDVSNIWTGSAFTGKHSNLGVAGIPTGPAGQTGSPLDGQSYVISAGTAHPFEAYQFISFMSSTASQVAIAKANHTLPTRQSAYQDGVSSDPVIKDFLSIENTAVARPAIPQTGHLFDAFDPNIAGALDNVESPIAALNAVAEAWKQLLAG